ncbi:MAG: trypsin-like peptidase domain-containing protein [Pseudomonadota bacterium]|nr:trypsin-like peptidase domain-containing protein [Pseudomonadota bacterium]
MPFPPTSPSLEATARRIAMRSALATAGLSLLLAACGGGESSVALASQAGNTPVLPAQPVRELAALENHSPVDLKLVQIKTLSQSAADRVTPQVITLPALSAEKSALTAPEPGQPQRIGVARALAQAAHADDTAQLLHWQPAPGGGQRAALAVRLEGASAVRLGLRITQLPPGTLLSVYAPGAPEAEQVHAAEVLRTIQNNLNAGTTGDDAYTYWLPTVSGPEAVLQIELPAGMRAEWLKLALPVVSHFVVDPATDDIPTKAAAACNIDVNCANEGSGQRTAVARMVFSDSQGSYNCSGALMNNTRRDGTPYFLTANHCLSTQAVASSLETFWNYRSSTCNGSSLSNDFRRVGGGARLLWTHAATDATLLQINGALPDNRTYLGWNASAASGTGSVFGIHHPAGDWQKFSAGQLHGFASCQNTGGNGVSCADTNASTGGYLVVAWTRGTTEGGSSGSPLFSSNSQVIGQLYAGGGDCSSSIRAGAYGRLDWSFDAGLAQWLSPSAATPPPAPGTRAPIYRFYNRVTGAHFYTINPLERDFVIAAIPDYTYEDTAYSAYVGEVSNASPVYRFYNRVTGVHFYTINPRERDYVNAALPDFDYEGPAWSARTSAGDGTSPVYRFYSSVRRGHFYTINPRERDFILSALPDFTDEGVAYYAWPAQ